MYTGLTIVDSTSHYKGCVFTRDASAVYATALCLSVCLSQVGVLFKRLDRLSWFLAQRRYSTYSTPCCKGILVFSKMRVLLSGGTSPQTMNLPNFLLSSPRHGTWTVASVVKLSSLDRRQSPVQHTKRPPLFATCGRDAQSRTESSGSDSSSTAETRS